MSFIIIFKKLVRCLFYWKSVLFCLLYYLDIFLRRQRHLRWNALRDRRCKRVKVREALRNQSSVPDLVIDSFQGEDKQSNTASTFGSRWLGRKYHLGPRDLSYVLQINFNTSTPPPKKSIWSFLLYGTVLYSSYII